VVGIVEGSDAELKDTYVAVGAHYDHVGYAEVDSAMAAASQAALPRCAHRSHLEAPTTTDRGRWR
jgi:hypothetical protein